MSSLLEVVNKETGESFFPMRPTERKPIGFDFALDLDPGETIVSATCTFANKAIQGDDASDALDGDPEITPASPLGTSVMQWIDSPVLTGAEPTLYELIITVVTTTTERSSPGLEIRVSK